MQLRGTVNWAETGRVCPYYWPPRRICVRVVEESLLGDIAEGRRITVLSGPWIFWTISESYRRPELAALPVDTPLESLGDP